MISVMVAKWVMILVVLTPCTGCADGVAVSQTYYETREMCLRAANFATKEIEIPFRDLRTKAVCVQSSK